MNSSCKNPNLTTKKVLPPKELIRENVSSIRNTREEDFPAMASVLKDKKINLSAQKGNLRLHSLDSLNVFNFKDQRLGVRKESRRARNTLETPDVLNLIREEDSRGAPAGRESAKHIQPDSKLEQHKKPSLHRSQLHNRDLGWVKLVDQRSSELVSSTQSQTFSEIEKQYNNLIEKALDISISNKEFSKMSSLRTNYVGYAVGKFGSERTNTIFQNEFNGAPREVNRSSNFPKGLPSRISPNLG